MLRLFKYVVFVLLFIRIAPVQAQIRIGATENDSAKAAQLIRDADSAKVATPLKVDYLTDPLHSTRFQSIDTSLNGWQLTRPLYADGLGRTFLSEALTATRNLVFDESDFTHPVLLTDPFAIYQFNPQSLRFYNGTRRYTNIEYIQGPEHDQQVQVNYGQLISKRFFAGFDYLRGGSEGYFLGQEASRSDLDLWTNYYSKDFRYRVFADVIWDATYTEENGGIKNYNTSQQAETLPIYLDSSQNRTKTRYVNLIQFWSPSFLSPANADTTNGHFNSYSKFLPNRLFLSSSFQRNTYTFSDQSFDTDSNFFQHTYYNANSTQDSIINDHLSNKFGIQGHIGNANDSTSSPASFEASVNYEYFSFRQGDQTFLFPAVLQDFTDLSAFAQLKNDNSKLFWLLNSTYYIDGRNQNDYSANAKLGYHVSNAFALDVHAGDALTKPSLLEDYYYSNNFMWNNNFAKKQINKAGATISSLKYKFDITADYYLLNNFIYFDSTAMPAQIDQQKLMSLKINDKIRWKRWNLVTKVIYQHVDGNDVLRLPVWQTYNSLYYQNPFFRSALFAQIGVDVRYVSDYFGDAYMPATRIFYLQNNQQAGSYQTVDLFFNMRIKSARIYLKFENVGQLIDNKTYYYVPGNFPGSGYPLTPFTIRLGISIQFFDVK